MERTKKILLISSLISLCITCLFFILAIFEVKVFDGIWLRFLLIFASLCVGCGFLVNELNILKRNKILGIISISFLGVSIFFALIIFCTPLFDEGSVFNTITVIIALFSTFFMIVISLVTKLERKLLILQISTYVILFLLEILISILIAGYPLFNVNAMTEIFSVVCVISVGLLIALWILSTKKSSTNESLNNSQEFIKVLKSDYENLIEENKKLKKQIEMLTKKD